LTAQSKADSQHTSLLHCFTFFWAVPLPDTYLFVLFIFEHPPTPIRTQVLKEQEIYYFFSSLSEKMVAGMSGRD
jgi:hypothetical protein